MPVVDDDDSVIVPPPPIEYLGHVEHHHAPAPRKPVFQDVNSRRTLIPILLTTGVSMIALGAAKFLVNEDSPLGLQPGWVAYLCFAIGAICVAGGILSMLQLQQILAKNAAKAAKPAVR